MAGSISCVYELDEKFRIVSVGAGWAEFAMTNRAPELVPPPGPLGQSALSCIADSTSEQVFDRLFRRVTETGRAIEFPFRCDSPTLRRFMEFRIEPRNPAGLRIETTMERVEARAPVALLEPRREHNGDLLRMCGWCKAVDLDGRWCEVEEALTAMRLFERDQLPAITHGMCPSCSERMLQMLDEA